VATNKAMQENRIASHPRYIFGPVPSRRLGLSLGVDLVPFKTCTHNCIYCQLGQTTNKTVRRAEYVPVAEVLAQLQAVLASGPKPDVVTLAGSGEPTLHSRLEEVIAGIRRLTDVPVVILTNGSLLDQPDVRRACAPADIVVPSLDAGTEETFQRINRPVPGMTLARHVDGLASFRAEFRGKLWLEIMLVDGVNTSDDEIAHLRSLAERIRPDRIQLNTVVRPPTEANAGAVSHERMAEICRAMGPLAEIIAPVQPRHAIIPGAGPPPRTLQDVLAMIQRHPCTAEDVASGLGIPGAEANRLIEHLLADRLIRRRRRGRREYYEARVHS
jgi:wyosine [tRNA(Phe)-imidazoG37] synthetase (radical SAM superfamily)